MKGKTKPAAKAGRNRYSTEFKQQALTRAEENGVVVAAKDLGLQESQIYTWHIKARTESQATEEQRLLQSEHALLRREVARLGEKNAFLKRRQHTSRSSPSEVRHDPLAGRRIPGPDDVLGLRRFAQRLL